MWLIFLGRWLPNTSQVSRKRTLALIILATMAFLLLIPAKQNLTFSSSERQTLTSWSKAGYKAPLLRGLQTKEEADAATADIEAEGGYIDERNEGEMHTGLIHNWCNLSQSEINALSVSGRRVFLQENVGTAQKRNFTILVWKHGPSMAKRLINEFGKEKLDPFRMCSVRSCRITYSESLASEADAILFNIQKTGGPLTYPVRTNYNQRWVWMTDEAPYYSLRYAKDRNISHYNGYFNWSMCYRMECDVHSLYGRTVEMTDSEAASYQKVDYFNIKSKTVGALISNCGSSKNKRLEYIKELQKYIDIDIYGKCGTLECHGHYNRDCDAINDYKFFLTFENSNCKEYITEKVWWQAFQKGTVPVVMGAKQEEYKKILPPGSFIHVNDFETPYLLAKYLVHLSQHSAQFMEYHAWRLKYQALNEHAYFGAHAYHYCRLCEALNYNDPAPKVYDHLEEFWNADTQCYPPAWESKTKGG